MTEQKLLLENPAPYVSATQWAIIDRKKGNLLFGKCETERRQVASLTKIMTAMVVLDLIEKFEGTSQWSSLNTNIKISRPVSRIQGTSANLIEGDTLTVNELLYGMMLPSGNDASVALGTHFGGLLRSNGTLNPEIVVTDAMIDRRLRATKIVAAHDYLEELEKGNSDRPDLMSDCQ